MTPRKFFVGRAIGLIILLIIIGIVAAFYALNNHIYEEKQAYAAKDFKDTEYVIEGNRIRLENGIADTAGVRYFGNEVMTDLDGDGREDVAFLITQEPGGSGTFYYVVGALNTERGYVGSEAFFLGDRIAPQTTEKGRGRIVVVNYADRALQDNFSTPASINQSRWLLLDPQSMQFGEVEKDFEGEADPSRMTLQMKTWTWISALYNDGRELRPRAGKTFTLAFDPDGTFSATTDCNSMGGNYVAKDSAISFSQIISTEMYCEGSQEADFAHLLQEAQIYSFTSRGELILDLKFDSGSAVFR